MYKVLIHETTTYEVDVEHSEFCPTPEDAKRIALTCLELNEVEYVSTTLTYEIMPIEKENNGSVNNEN